MAKDVTAAPGARIPRTLAPDLRLEGELMGAVFGDGYDPRSRQALAMFEDGGGYSFWLMRLVSVGEFGSGTKILVVSGMLADETDADDFSREWPSVLGVYIVQPGALKWKVLARHENIALKASYRPTGIEWVALGADTAGFLALSRRASQGYAMTVADIFEFGADVRRIGQFNKQFSSALACTSEHDACWDIDSSIAVDHVIAHEKGYRDLVVNFSGKRFKLVENGAGEGGEQILDTIRQTARYRFDGRQYLPVAGSNPVPEL